MPSRAFVRSVRTVLGRELLCVELRTSHVLRKDRKEPAILVRLVVCRAAGRSSSPPCGGQELDQWCEPEPWLTVMVQESLPRFCSECAEV